MRAAWADGPFCSRSACLWAIRSGRGARLSLHFIRAVSAGERALPPCTVVGRAQAAQRLEEGVFGLCKPADPTWHETLHNALCAEVAVFYERFAGQLEQRLADELERRRRVQTTGADDGDGDGDAGLSPSNGDEDVA